MNSAYASYLDKLLRSTESDAVKEVEFMRFFMTITHEMSHKVNHFDGWVTKEGVDENLIRSKVQIIPSSEEGDQFERNVWGRFDSYDPKPETHDSQEGVIGIHSHKYVPGVTEGVIREAKKTEEGRKALPTVPKT